MYYTQLTSYSSSANIGVIKNMKKIFFFEIKESYTVP